MAAALCPSLWRNNFSTNLGDEDESFLRAIEPQISRNNIQKHDEENDDFGKTNNNGIVSSLPALTRYRYSINSKMSAHSVGRGNYRSSVN